jgi:hypothetical protein
MKEFKNICTDINSTCLNDEDKINATLLAQTWLAYCEIKPSVEMFHEMGIPCNDDSIDCDIYFAGILRYFIAISPACWEVLLNECNLMVWYNIYGSVSDWLRESD